MCECTGEEIAGEGSDTTTGENARVAVPASSQGAFGPSGTIRSCFVDYNLGTPGWYAVSCFTVMVIGMSVICTWFRLKTGSLWTATFLHASHNLFIQGIFTPLTGDTGSTRYVVDEFGFVLPLVIGATAVWFWRRREVALAAWRDDSVDGGLPANQRLQPSAAAL